MKKITPSGKICIAISACSVSEGIATAVKVEKDADVVEIRLDALEKIELKPFVDTLKKPLLFTNRAAWEGGSFQGSEEDRVAFLQEAIDLQVSYIDIELKTKDQFKMPIIPQAKQKGVTTIVSWHHFDGTPSSPALISILQEQYRTGADVGKIVTMASNYQDVLRVLNLQIAAAEIGFPLIAFCMGAAGVVSRVATLALGGYMTYAAVSKTAETAPGQITADKLHRALREINGEN